MKKIQSERKLITKIMQIINVNVNFVTKDFLLNSFWQQWDKMYWSKTLPQPRSHNYQWFFIVFIIFPVYWEEHTVEI